MAKQFLANRSGQNPTLDEVPNETIKIYATEADLDADLANLEENEIVATDEDNNPASGTQYPVDVVQKGNMNAVTSNAVYDAIPVGIILPYGGTSVPNSNYLLCNGQAVSRIVYADLFAAIGTAYGVGDDSTTFNVPDMRESVPKGAGLTGLSNNHLDANGLAVGEFIDDRVQTHTHGSVGGSGNGGVYINGTSTTLGDILSTDIRGQRTGPTTEVKSVGCNYVIKAK